MSRWGLTIPLTGVPLARAPGDRGGARRPRLHRRVVGRDQRHRRLHPAGARLAVGAPATAGARPSCRSTRAAPALLAQHAATLAGLAPGRFVLGIGTSSPAIVERWNGIPFTEPYQRVRDTLRFLRRALAGEKVTDEALGVKGFKLDNAPETAAADRPRRAAPRHAAPGRPRGRRRDHQLARPARTYARYGPSSGGEKELIARIFVCPTTDADEARAIGRWMIAAYLTVPVYAAFHEWLGRGERLAAMNEAWAAGDRKAALNAVPDEVVDESGRPRAAGGLPRARPGVRRERARHAGAGGGSRRRRED